MRFEVKDQEEKKEPTLKFYLKKSLSCDKGINLWVDEDNGENYSVLRITEKGIILTENIPSNIGLAVDDEGVLKIIK